TTYATQLQTVKSALNRNEQQLMAARQAFDKAMQVKQAFMREKDRKTNDAMQALRDARRAKWQSKVADAMESFQVAGIDATHDEMLQKIQEKTAVNEARMEMAMSNVDTQGMKIEEEAEPGGARGRRGRGDGAAVHRSAAARCGCARGPLLVVDEQQSPVSAHGAVAAGTVEGRSRMRSRGWALLLLAAAGCSRCGEPSARTAEELLPGHPGAAVVTARLGAIAQHLAALADRASSLPGGEQLGEVRRAVAARSGFDPLTREGLLAAGLDPDRGAAAALFEGPRRGEFGAAPPAAQPHPSG